MTTNFRDPIPLGPITITFSVLAEDSNGTVTMSRCDVEAGGGLAVPHFHDGFEETLYGLEGITTLVVDGETIELGPGDTYCIRRGAVHTFAARESAVSFIAIATPGVFGPEYFLELRDILGNAGPAGPDPQAVGEVMLRHGLTPQALH